MNGPHDVGGRGDFGTISPDPDEPLFHADWERRVLGVTLCCGALGHWTLDQSRHARESLSPALYYSSSYYAIWLEALGNLLVQHGEASRQELDSGVMEHPGKSVDRRLDASRVPAVLATGAPTSRIHSGTPRFAIDDQVRTRADHKPGHSRLPGYARDKCGRILFVHEAHVLPDSSAAGTGESPDWLYTVAFDGKALWGDNAEAGSVVTIEAWECYLDAL